LDLSEVWGAWDPTADAYRKHAERRLRYLERMALGTPYPRQITIRLDTAAVDYFKEMAAELGMPYQNLINLFLRDCAIEKRRPVIQWPQEPPKRAVGR
jgi:uncharacterized protein (DUF4415 family)